jgi:hypothetical protein
MQRAMDYFASPRQPAGIELHSNGDTIIARPGDTVTRTILVRNVSEVATDTVTLSLNGGAWSHVISPAAMVVGSCKSASVTLTARFKRTWTGTKHMTLMHGHPFTSVATQVALTTKTPASVAGDGERPGSQGWHL